MTERERGREEERGGGRERERNITSIRKVKEEISSDFTNKMVKYRML